jgi:Domain of unknown function (DUF6745)
MPVIRSSIEFLRRSWTGDEMTRATGLVGIAMFVGVVWLVETLASTGLRALGMLEPTATVSGWIVAGTYVVLAGVHDYRAQLRRQAREHSRKRTQALVGSLGLEWLAAGQGRVIDTDLDTLGLPRRLWRYEDEPGGAEVVAVEVSNSTPEPDGSRRPYFLRVPPGVRTCRAAVAWTFSMHADDYDPASET